MFRISHGICSCIGKIKFLDVDVDKRKHIHPCYAGGTPALLPRRGIMFCLALQNHHRLTVTVLLISPSPVLFAATTQYSNLDPRA
uniref:Uncharacterized protein n=1 Tax=Candidatus Kentrum sp. SD TaxID=2126332 RepID=A0A450YI92_9GAMM|nr:MAG: hypothetical protein BECKSD772F_GA0070984_101711 [Candidatus Kentron sp. SD]VFK41282.1 MAG: hypothetical protein BECKSD772E_GA0070983_10116 [Candidatus Kentron sp. SD]